MAEIFADALGAAHFNKVSKRTDRIGRLICPGNPTRYRTCVQRASECGWILVRRCNGPILGYLYYDQLPAELWAASSIGNIRDKVGARITRSGKLQAKRPNNTIARTRSLQRRLQG